MKHGKAVPLVLTVTFLAVCGIVFFFITIDEQTADVGGGSSLSARGADAINRYCRDVLAVIHEMPGHPRTDEVLGHIVEIWTEDARVDERTALEGITKAFKDSPLGLAAFDRYLSFEFEMADEFCRELVQQGPDSRAACMALDHLVNNATPDTAEALLDSVIETGRDTRVGVFALLCKGDRAREQGEMDAAARCWLECWLADAKRAKSVYDKLCAYWLENGDWYYALLMPAEFREDAVLTAVKQYALAGVEGPGASVRAQFREAGKALQSGNMEGAAAAIEQAITDGTVVGAEDKALLGMAVFLLGTEKDYTITLDLASSLKARRALTQCREHCLQWAQEGLESLPRELQACYALQAAKRRLQDGQAGPALDLLQATWRGKALPAWWRERVLEELANRLVEERGDYEGSGRAYAAYCDESPQNEAKLRLIAADHFYRAQEYAKSLEQIDKVLAAAKGEAELPGALLLSALDYLGQKNSEGATAALEQLALNHPQNELAARALFLLGKMSLAAGDSTKAQSYYVDLMDRYPKSKPALEAESVLAQMKGLK